MCLRVELEYIRRIAGKTFNPGPIVDFICIPKDECELNSGDSFLYSTNANISQTQCYSVFSSCV